jgi:hypothetical protein
MEQTLLGEGRKKYATVEGFRSKISGNIPSGPMTLILLEKAAPHE